MRRYAIAGVALVCCLGLNSFAIAHELSKDECSEGGDFIRNAAMSRDNGMDGTTFVTKMLADLVAIRSFPLLSGCRAHPAKPRALPLCRLKPHDWVRMD